MGSLSMICYGVDASLERSEETGAATLPANVYRSDKHLIEPSADESFSNLVGCGRVGCHSKVKGT